MNFQGIVAQFDLAAEEALDRSKLSLLDRVRVRRSFRKVRRSTLVSCCDQFAADNGYEQFAAEDGEDNDHPILDFWKWLIESGKLAAFLQKLVTEYLPAIFAMILDFIKAIIAL